MRISRDLRNPTVLIRLGVDLAMLHISMFLAISTAAAFYKYLDPSLNAALLLHELGNYYKVFALCASPVFLAILYSNGAYSRKTLASSLWQQYRNLAQAMGLAMAIVLTLNYLIFRSHILARSVALAFLTYVVCAFFLSRWLESILRPEFKITRRVGSSERSVDAPILIIGGAGYIGSMLCRNLLAAGERVRVLDSLVYGDFAIRDLIANPSFELVVGDCRHIQSVVHAIHDVKAIAVLAAIVGDPACDQDQESALEINYAATRMLIEVAKGHNIDRVVFASSCSVYGATDELMTELSPSVPVSLYGRTKIDSERALLEARSDTFHPVILRLATVFGNGYRPRFDLLVNLLAARAVQDKVITIYNEHQWRPFIHVWDVARGFAAALTAPRDRVSGEIFNLGDNRMNFTLKEVAEEVRGAFPQTEVKYISNADTRTYRVDFAKARRELDFRCTVSLKEGIDELRRALEDGSVADYTDARYNNQKFLSAYGRLTVARDVDRRIMAAFLDQESATHSSLS
jgi:nucleoside-diphosphate-sugar epimerase